MEAETTDRIRVAVPDTQITYLVRQGLLDRHVDPETGQTEFRLTELAREGIGYLLELPEREEA